MTVCSSCGTETDNKDHLCTPCRKTKLIRTWKKQIRIYSIIILVGAAASYYAVGEIKVLPQSQASEGIPPILMATAAFGGLCILGGLFGLALALFFNLLHRNKSN